MTVRAEGLAWDAFAAYLLRTLPAKVETVNAARAATVTLPRAGPYIVPAGASLALGARAGGEIRVALTSGSRTAAQIATELAGVSGITASADSLGRLVLTADEAPSEGIDSVLSIAPDGTGAAEALGLSPGGTQVIRAAIKAPTYDGVAFGVPQRVDFGEGFWVIGKRRSTMPRSPNIRDDVRVVALQFEILACEPNARATASPEFSDACVQAVRECLVEDRSLDGRVHLVREVSTVADPGVTYVFPTAGGVSPLFTATPMAIEILVFERSGT